MISTYGGLFFIVTGSCADANITSETEMYKQQYISCREIYARSISLATLFAERVAASIPQLRLSA